MRNPVKGLARTEPRWLKAMEEISGIVDLIHHQLEFFLLGVFWRGVSEEDAMVVADMEYWTQKKAKKKRYRELKEIAHSEGKKPPPNPYPSAIKEIQAEENKYVMDRLFNPKVIKIADKMKEERRQVA